MVKEIARDDKERIEHLVETFTNVTRDRASIMEFQQDLLNTDHVTDFMLQRIVPAVNFFNPQIFEVCLLISLTPFLLFLIICLSFLLTVPTKDDWLL